MTWMNESILKSCILGINVAALITVTNEEVGHGYEWLPRQHIVVPGNTWTVVVVTDGINR